jgi:hypothetical protein
MDFVIPLEAVGKAAMMSLSNSTEPTAAELTLSNKSCRSDIEGGCGLVLDDRQEQNCP